MAQISIPMSNKVGYSMYWNSMWDSKINFARGLKEDIYINKFIPLVFEDKISLKVLKTLDFKKIDFNLIANKYNIHVKKQNMVKNNFYKYIKDLNKVSFFKSKIWILKYQKWVIIYFFMYLPIFNKDRKIAFKNKFFKNSVNLGNLLTSYKIINLKINHSYNFFNNNVNKNYF